MTTAADIAWMVRVFPAAIDDVYVDKLVQDGWQPVSASGTVKEALDELLAVWMAIDSDPIIRDEAAERKAREAQLVVAVGRYLKNP